MPRRSKTLAAWLAVTVGALGAHRFYLFGPRDIRAWAYWPPTLLGLWGVLRMRELGQDDHLAWLLIPLLGLTLSAAMLAAIVLALTADEKWAQRHNRGTEPVASGWGAVLAAIAGLALGGVVLMGTIAFGLQKLFEWQLEPPPAAVQKSN